MDSNNWRVKREPTDAPAREQQPIQSYGQRRSNGFTRGFDSSRSRQHERSDRQGVSFGGIRKPDQSRGHFRKPLDKEKAERAIEEGRRVWVGNMPYEAAVQDLEFLFQDIADEIESINMSVDPMTGRNPSYCFVDFNSREQAERAMEAYNGREFMGRPLGVKPGVKSGKGKGAFHMRPEHLMEDRKPRLDRWNRLETPREMSTATEENRRLWVGSLPRFQSQFDSENQIRELFESRGFKPEVISKVVSNHAVPKGVPGNHNYCFVDFQSTREAEEARNALQGVKRWDDCIKVNYATGSPRKLDERERKHGDQLPELEY